MCHPRPNVWQQRNLYRKRFPSSIRPVSGAVPGFKPGALPAPKGERILIYHVILDKGWVRGKKFLTKKKLGFAGKQKPEAVEM